MMEIVKNTEEISANFTLLLIRYFNNCLVKASINYYL